MLKKDKSKKGCKCESSASTTSGTTARKAAVHSTKAEATKSCSAKAKQTSATSTKSCSAKATKGCAK